MEPNQYENMKQYKKYIRTYCSAFTWKYPKNNFPYPVEGVPYWPENKRCIW
jgi:hypothetical protein